MKEGVTIVGMGPGDLSLLSERAKGAIAACDCLIGGKRNLCLIQADGKQMIEIRNNLTEIITFIQKNWKKRKIAVLASGDPFLYGIGSYLSRMLQGVPLETISGISAVSYLMAKTGKKLEAFHFASIHGRQENYVSLLKQYGKIVLFCGSHAEGVLQELARTGYSDTIVTAGENLSYPEERILTGTAMTLQNEMFSELTLLLLEGTAEKTLWPYCTGGIAGSYFLQEGIPMTKEEVRAVSIAKLRLLPDSIVCDIGAGSGSVAIEVAHYIPNGKVYALEKNPAACQVIIENCKRFRATNVKVLSGNAAETFLTLEEKPNRVFLGGTGGEMERLLTEISRLDNVRVVLNAVTIESAYEALKLLERLGFSAVEICSISIAKGKPLGGKHILEPQNTVMILSGGKEKQYEGNILWSRGRARRSRAFIVKGS